VTEFNLAWCVNADVSASTSKAGSESNRDVAIARSADFIGRATKLAAATTSCTPLTTPHVSPPELCRGRGNHRPLRVVVHLQANDSADSARVSRVRDRVDARWSGQNGHHPQSVLEFGDWSLNSHRDTCVGRAAPLQA